MTSHLSKFNLIITCGREACIRNVLAGDTAMYDRLIMGSLVVTMLPPYMAKGTLLILLH